MNLNKKNITDLDLNGKRVIMRVDFNVPFDGDKITNNQRIVGAIPTIEYALKNGAKSVVLMSHLGRPDGNVTKESLKPVAVRLQELLGKPVTFLPDCVGADTEKACADPAPGTVFLLENLRFHVEEEGKGIDHEAGCPGAKCEKKAPSKGEKCKAKKATPEQLATFRKSLTSLGDIYVNDAFGTAHRGHSSMVGIDLPEKVAGLLIAKELAAFTEVIKTPQKPLVAIVGGAKISDKIKLINNLIEKADGIIICGGMAYTFLKVCHGMEIGKSLFDKAGADIVQGILDKAKEWKCEVTFPVDWICGQDFKNDQELKTVTKEEGIPEGWEGMDCGPKSIELFQQVIGKAKTVVWNGPAGVFEFENFSKGTNGILNAVAKLHASGGRGIIGGGDSATAAANAGMEDKVSFVSTGGGASLELLEGKLLPGIEYLANKAEEAGYVAGDAPKVDDGATPYPDISYGCPMPEKLTGEKMEKKMKKIIKEGGKRGVEIEGAADMGGLQFFCTTMLEPGGDVDMLYESMRAMNEKSDPAEEERKGGSGRIGKMLISVDQANSKLALVGYCPSDKHAELKADQWMQELLKALGGGEMSFGDAFTAKATIENNPEKNLFVLKLKDNAISQAILFLKSKGLFPDKQEDSDDDYIFGDDDFPS